MKTCPNCGAQIEDNNVFCHVCGTNLDNPIATEQNARPAWDHTGEFSEEDVHNNKVIAMIMYLSGLYGTLVCFAILWLIGKGKSDYLFFHVKENFKITLVNTLLILFAGFFFWTVVIPIAACICGVIILVLRFICFVQVAKNQSKEVAIIRGLKFLK
ncbi:MAG: zinc ribbon domain-containing protein [Lachnospiraceae bacterium]|nr:zinc ribbon domain-containing protein [Lachnospiraceae bacterium]